MSDIEPTKTPVKRAQPARPAGIKQPQDHKKSAAQLEAEGVNTATVEFWGMEFTFSTDPMEWSEEASLAFEENRFGVFLKEAVGAQQYYKYTHSDPRPKRSDTMELFKLVAKSLGGDAGE